MSISAFLESRCAESIHDRVQSHVLYRAYVAYCQESNIPIDYATIKSFSTAMKKLIPRRRYSQGMFFIGISVRDSTADTTPPMEERPETTSQIQVSKDPPRGPNAQADLEQLRRVLGTEDVGSYIATLANEGETTIQIIERNDLHNTEQPNVISLGGGSYDRVHVPEQLWIRFAFSCFVSLQQGVPVSYQEVVKGETKVRVCVTIDSIDPVTNDTLELIKRKCRQAYHYYHDTPTVDREVIVARNISGPNRRIRLIFPDLITTGTILRNITLWVREHCQSADGGFNPNIINSSLRGLTLPYCCEGQRIEGYDPVHQRDFDHWRANTNNYYALDYEGQSDLVHALCKVRVQAFSWEQVPPYHSRDAPETIRESFPSALLPQVYQALSKIIDISAFEQQQDGGRIILHRLRASHCGVCDRVHSSENATLYYSNKAVYFYCRCKAQPRLLLALLAAGGARQEIKRRLFGNALQRFTTCPQRYGFEVESSNRLYVDVPDLGKRVTIIRSKMGSGKTQALITYLSRHQGREIQSAVVLTCRRSLTDDIYSRFRALGFVNYQEEKGSLDQPYTIVSAESLHRLARIPDLLIIDEVTSFWHQMDSRFHRERLSTNRKRLHSLLKESGRCIFLDADIDEKTLYIASVYYAPETVFVQWNERKIGEDQHRHVHWVNSTDFYISLFRDLAANKNLHIIVASEAEGLVIERRLLEIGLVADQYRYYHSGKGNLHEFQNINEVVSVLRVLMHTSTVLVGVDISVCHFHRQYVYACPSTNTVREVKQMMGRVRFFHEPDIYLTVGKSGPVTYFPLNYHQVRELLIDKARSCDGYKELPHWLIESYTENGYFRHRIKNNIWAWLFIHNTIGKTFSRVYFTLLLEWVLREELGYIVSREKRNTIEGAVTEERAAVIEAKTLLSETRIELYEATNVTQLRRGSFLEEIEKKYRGGLPCTDGEIIALEKDKFLDLFKEEHQASINGAIFEVMVYQMRGVSWLTNARLSLDYNPDWVLKQDIANSREPARGEDPLFVKMELVRELTQIWGFRSCVDRETKVRGDDVSTRLEQYQAIRDDLILHFSLRVRIGGVATPFKDMVNRTRQVLKSWCGSKLVASLAKRSQRRGLELRTYSYRLACPELSTGKDERLVRESRGLLDYLLPLMNRHIRLDDNGAILVTSPPRHSN